MSLCVPFDLFLRVAEVGRPAVYHANIAAAVNGVAFISNSKRIVLSSDIYGRAVHPTRPACHRWRLSCVACSSEIYVSADDVTFTLIST
jgi:hypothetical protein